MHYPLAPTAIISGLSLASARTISINLSMEDSLRYGQRPTLNLRQNFLSTVVPMLSAAAASSMGRW